MSAPERLTGSLAALNDRELEILRLLTAGHTVKSIAAQFGRSEASINERLRDARRKTGVGSSRELARLIDAARGREQKNRDRNFDLPSPAAPAKGWTAPRIPGRRRSKGTMIMLLAMPLAAAGLAIAANGTMNPPATAPAVEAAAPRQTPLAGTWSLDVARIPAEERPQRVTIAFRLAPDSRWTTVVDIVSPDGTSSHAESTAATDGVAVPVSGNMAFIDTVSLRQPAPGTLVMTLGKAGSPVSTRVYTVQADRRVMTETIIWASSAMPGLETTYFHRVD